MEIILLEQVKKLGNVGDVVTVKNGYGRNFLIPNNKALLATKANREFFEARKAEIEADNARRTQEAEKIAKGFESKIVTVISQAGEDGRLFGSVGSSDIAKAINDANVERKQIVLNNPIKYIGIHSVDIAFHGTVSATIYVNIARTDDEAADIEARFKRGDIQANASITATDNAYEDDADAQDDTAEDAEEEAAA